MELNIREATTCDYDGVHHLQRQVHEIHVKGSPDHYKTATITLDKTYYENLVENENAKVFLLENEEQVIAYTVLKIKQPKERPIIIPKKVVSMEDLGVDFKFRGKGMGKKLVKQVFEFAKEIKADSIELGVWEFNKEAINFYETMGFKTKMRRMEITL